MLDVNERIYKNTKHVYLHVQAMDKVKAKKKVLAAGNVELVASRLY